MIRKYIIVADDSFKGFDEGIEDLERKWGAEEIEPCEDAISRQAAIDIIYDYEYKKDMRKAFENLPPVTPQPKISRWEWVQYDGNPNIGNWHCSECRTIIPHMPEETDNTPIYKWCPMCGARMEVEE